jgi:hypothetical protein
MFVNYFGQTERGPPPLNLAVGRVILGSYLIWKTVWYDWTMVTAVPFAFSNPYTFALPPVPLLLTIEKGC